jgi:hypothetical protein
MRRQLVESPLYGDTGRAERLGQGLLGGEEAPRRKAAIEYAPPERNVELMVER